MRILYPREDGESRIQLRAENDTASLKSHEEPH